MLPQVPEGAGFTCMKKWVAYPIFISLNGSGGESTLRLPRMTIRYSHLHPTILTTLGSYIRLRNLVHYLAV